MRTQPDAAKDRSAGLTPAIVPRARWRVAHVEPAADFVLRVRFLDGLEGVVDMRRLVLDENAGVFAALSDFGLFRQVRLEHGAVTWPGDIDLAPDAMYRAIAADGCWIL